MAYKTFFRFPAWFLLVALALPVVARAQDVNTEKCFGLRGNSVLALTYHYIEPLPVEAKTGQVSVDWQRRDLTVTPEQFAKHLDALQAAGFQAITFSQLLEACQGRRELPAKTVAITIDDAYRQAVRTASQLLAERKMVATFAVIAARTGEGELADWSDLLEAKKLGMELVSHSAYHPDFGKIDFTRQKQEIRGAIKVLRNFSDFNRSLFVYPYGRYTGWTLQALHDNNVVAAFSTRVGVVTSQSKMLELPRIKMHGADYLNAFFYQWLKKDQTNQQYARRH